VQERFLQEVKKAYTSMYGADPKSSEAVARIVTTGNVFLLLCTAVGVFCWCANVKLIFIRRSRTTLESIA